MNCVHGRPFGAFCPHCHQILGPRAPAPIVVPPYTFRPFEPVDSTVYPFVVSSAGVPAGVPAAPPAIASGMSWGPPPPVMVDSSQPGGPTLLLDSTQWQA